MSDIEKTLEKMRLGPTQIRYAELFRVCVRYFGEPRQHGTSHAVFKTPWAGDPRVNIQNAKGKAKPYQVHQVLAAVEKLLEMEKKQ
jgi:hypothetical protein